MDNLVAGNINKLYTATDDELYSVLGLYSISLTTNPSDVLDNGRTGEYWQAGPEVLGDEETFWHKKYAELGRQFLINWKPQIFSAICENHNVYSDLRKKGFREVDATVAVIVGALSTSIPILAPLTGLLVVIGVLVARTGIDAFCETIKER